MIPLIAERLGVDPADDLRPALIAGCAVAAMRVATTQWLLGDGYATAVADRRAGTVDAGAGVRRCDVSRASSSGELRARPGG